ncbi:hypothetical protein D3OALGB2SA_4821 [Olavius algarvensis associated proteobacterium Delta 3]|nr:hypothetical protein D3OALGB2SA_4821 [Olavius algarvensis associated proteobacterium Delta 3]
MATVRKNIVYNVFGQGASLVLSFIAVKYIFNILGKDALGIIYFTMTVNLLLNSVLSFGVTYTTVREVAAHTKTNASYIRDFIRTSTSLYWGTYLGVAALIYIMAAWIVDHWIILESLEKPDAVYILRILGIAALLAFPKTLYESLLKGLQRMDITNFIDVSTTALQQAGMIAILLSGGSLYMVIHWMALCYVLRIVVYLSVLTRYFPKPCFFPGFSMDVLRKNFHFTSRLIVSSLCASINQQADRLIISKLMPIGVMGYYGFVYGGLGRLRLLTGSVAQAVYPSFSALEKSGNRGTLLSQYRMAQDLVCFGLIPVYA